MYIQKERKKSYILSLESFTYFFSEEIAFKYFLFKNITKSRSFLFFSDHTDTKKWKLKIFLKIMTTT